MNKEEQTRKLIRLKRHETPREGYFEDFLDEFRERRRREASPQRHPVARVGFFKRWREGSPKVRILGFGVAYAALVAMMVWLPRGQDDGSDGNRQPVIYEPDPGDKPVPRPEATPPRPSRD